MPCHALIKPAVTGTPAGIPRRAVIRPLLALTGTLLLLALVPTSASASVGPGEPVADPQVDAWLGIARSWWGGAPDCPDGVYVDRAERVAGDSVWASAEMPGCHISLDPEFYPRPAAWTASPWARRQWQRQMCNVVVHEWGHLLGHAHASDPHDLMAPIVPLVVADCRPAAASSGQAAARAVGKSKKSNRSRARARQRRAVAASGPRRSMDGKRNGPSSRGDQIST